jgi:hypothetical protein
VTSAGWPWGGRQGDHELMGQGCSECHVQASCTSVNLSPLHNWNSTEVAWTVSELGSDEQEAREAFMLHWRYSFRHPALKKRDYAAIEHQVRPATSHNSRTMLALYKAAADSRAAGVVGDRRYRTVHVLNNRSAGFHAH